MNLHTRATCDACRINRATVEIDSGFFLCDFCADIVITSVSVTPVSASSEGVSAVAGKAPAPGSLPATAINSEFIPPGPSLLGERYSEGRLQRELPSPGLRPESGGVTPTAQMTRADGSKRAEVQGSAPVAGEGGRPSTNSVSDGALRTSLPSGEMEPSVMLASAPSGFKSALEAAKPAGTAIASEDPPVAVAVSGALDFECEVAALEASGFAYPDFPDFLRRPSISAAPRNQLNQPAFRDHHHRNGEDHHCSEGR